MDQFNDRIKKELTAEELAKARPYAAKAPDGTISIRPIISGHGREVRYEANVYIRGVSGPVRLTRASLDRIGAPEDWFDKAQALLEALQGEFPQLPGGIPEKPGHALMSGEDDIDANGE